jgi:hypothetical protein
MTISALVVTLNPPCAEEALAALARDPRLTLGEPVDARVPIVAETPTLRAGKELCRELELVPGVAFVSVVRIDFLEEEEEER